MGLRAPICSSLLIVLVVLPYAFAHSSEWKEAHATYYGSPDGTIGGACGYEEYKKTYGPYTAAVSTPLFHNAAGCGACYEIRCVKSKVYCKKGHQSVVVTVTDLCPPGGWCTPPHTHFDLSKPAFLKIADQVAGHVPVMYRSVPCKRKGGGKFKISGNPYFNLVTVTNVGGGGDVKKLEVNKTSRGEELKRNSRSPPWTGKSQFLRMSPPSHGSSARHLKATTSHKTKPIESLLNS